MVGKILFDVNKITQSPSDILLMIPIPISFHSGSFSIVWIMFCKSFEAQTFAFEFLLRHAHIHTNTHTHPANQRIHSMEWNIWHDRHTQNTATHLQWKTERRLIKLIAINDTMATQMDYHFRLSVQCASICSSFKFWWPGTDKKNNR